MLNTGPRCPRNYYSKNQMNRIINKLNLTKRIVVKKVKYQQGFC